MENTVELVFGSTIEGAMAEGHKLQNTLVYSEKGRGVEYLVNNLIVNTVSRYRMHDVLLWYKPFSYTANLWLEEQSRVEHFYLQLVLQKGDIPTLLDYAKRRARNFTEELPVVLAIVCVDVNENKRSTFKMLRDLLKLSESSGVYLTVVLSCTPVDVQFLKLFDLKLVLKNTDTLGSFLLPVNTDYDENNPIVKLYSDLANYTNYVLMYDYKFIYQFTSVDSEVEDCYVSRVDYDIVQELLNKN